MCLAIPGKIVELVPGPESWAIVDVVGLRRTVDISLVADDGAGPGDWVLIHVGFAMSKISEEAAVEQMQMLQLLGETASALEEVSGYGAGHPPDIWPGAPPGS
ncbi:MAG TPA: HypC/HybG/HupF family hydrogenase formation chaperone [Bryobacteraceae bacterium]|jgi:hydrogenase expression/formation protein HypC